MLLVPKEPKVGLPAAEPKLESEVLAAEASEAALPSVGTAVGFAVANEVVPVDLAKVEPAPNLGNAASVFLGSVASAALFSVGSSLFFSAALAKKAAVAALTGLGLTSAHSASVIPAGFCGSEAVAGVAGVVAGVAEVVGLNGLNEGAALLGPSESVEDVVVGGLEVVFAAKRGVVVVAEAFPAARAKKAAVAGLTGFGLTSAHSASLIPAGFCGSEGVEAGGAALEVVEDGFEAPAKKAAVAELTGFGRTSAHSASLIPAGFCGSEGSEGLVVALEVSEAAGFEALARKAAVAALTGFGRTSAHSASLIPAGFLGSESVDGVTLAAESEGLAASAARLAAPAMKAAVAELTGFGLTSAHSASLIPAGFVGSVVEVVFVVVVVLEAVDGASVARFAAPAKKAAVAELTGLGRTSAHSASLMPAGFCGSLEADAVDDAEGKDDAGLEAPERNAAVAALTGLGRTSSHSASLIPSGFFASVLEADENPVVVAGAAAEVGLKGLKVGPVLVPFVSLVLGAVVNAAPVDLASPVTLGSEIADALGGLKPRGADAAGASTSSNFALLADGALVGGDVEPEVAEDVVGAGVEEVAVARSPVAGLARSVELWLTFPMRFFLR